MAEAEAEGIPIPDGLELTPRFFTGLLQRLEQRIVDCKERHQQKLLNVDVRYCDDVLGKVFVVALLQIFFLTVATSFEVWSYVVPHLVPLWDGLVRRVTSLLSTTQYKQKAMTWAINGSIFEGVRRFLMRLSTLYQLSQKEGVPRVLRELIKDLGLELVAGSGLVGYKVVSLITRTLFLLSVDVALSITHKYFRLNHCQDKVKEDPNAAYYAAYREFDDGPLVLLGKWKESLPNNNHHVTVNTITRNGAPIDNGALPAPHDRCELAPAQAPVLQGFASDEFPHAYTKNLRIRFGDKTYAPDDNTYAPDDDDADRDTPCQGLNPRVVWPAEGAVDTLTQARTAPPAAPPAARPARSPPRRRPG